MIKKIEKEVEVEMEQKEKKENESAIDAMNVVPVQKNDIQIDNPIHDKTGG